MPGAGNRGGSLAGVFRPLIAGPSGSAVSPRLSGWPDQPGICHPLLHRRPAPQAQIASGLLSRPAPDSLIGVEVRAVARQVHQPQLQLRRPEVLPHRLPTVGWRIVPDDPQRPWMLFLAFPLSQMTRSGPGCFSFSCVRMVRCQWLSPGCAGSWTISGPIIRFGKNLIVSIHVTTFPSRGVHNLRTQCGGVTMVGIGTEGKLRWPPT